MTPADRRAALVDMVTEVMATVDNYYVSRDQAIAAIDIALEEAAQVAKDKARGQADGAAEEIGEDKRFMEHGEWVAAEIAAAIRALKSSAY